jgi:pimeloyl-ACP methyl ester carboxylesterase
MPLKRIVSGALETAYVEMGPADGPPAILLHGWPYDIHAFADAAPIIAASGHRVIIPYARGFGQTRFLSAATVRNGQPAVLALDVLALMDALRIDKAVIAGFDWGARSAAIVGALWPERVSGLVLVSGYLISSQSAGLRPLTPQAEQQWWYQYYFATERGRLGYEANRTDFARLIWQLGSPKWDFEEAVFLESAAALRNPDHVAVVVHNYRWRLGLANGEGHYDGIERLLAQGPKIAVPTLTMEGDANGAPHPLLAAYIGKFSGRHVHRTSLGGIGHNLPQEAPSDFARAVIDVVRWAVDGSAT